MEVVLLLTACIKPNVTDKIAVSDWKKRELMYMDALNWYLDLSSTYKCNFLGADNKQ